MNFAILFTMTFFSKTLFFVKCAKFELFFTEHSFATHGTFISYFVKGGALSRKGRKEFKEIYHIKALDKGDLKLNAREKNVHAGEKLEDFETHFRIKWC
jgi:hypothetical protein